jgi:VWFA-related protein
MLRCFQNGILIALTLTSASLARAGQNPSPPAPNPQANPVGPEIVTQEKPPSFQLKVQRNLVVVRAVVRDAKGNSVGHLTKENFHLYDNGKLQDIVQFTVEGGATEGGAKSSTPAPAAPGPAAARVAERFVALFFDDVQLSFEDVARTREAAGTYLDTMVGPGDRVAISTSSGQVVQDFTADLGKLHDALLRLRPRPIRHDDVQECPYIFPYQAYLIVHQQKLISAGNARTGPEYPDALRAAVDDVCECAPSLCPAAVDVAIAQAHSVLDQDQNQTEYYSLRELEQLVRRMATLPGQRSIVWVSPGFFTMDFMSRLSEIVDRALRAKVVINALDSRGLYVVPTGGDIRRPRSAADQDPRLFGRLSMMRMTAQRLNSDPLAEIALGTGGTLFENNNDFNEGFRRLGALPETSYVLEFSPQNLKANGSFHTLKVQLVDAPGLTVQARKGYFAPKELADAEAQATEEIREAAFSRDEVRELPVDFHTQFFRINDREVQLVVLTHIDLRPLPFRKQEQRNLDNLRVVALLFDPDGNLVTLQEKTVMMRLRDITLQRLGTSGITVKSNLKAAPGTYVVRVVVRDSEGKQLSGLNQTVEIPY